MIWQPKIGQVVTVNYGDRSKSNLGIAKKDMPCQGLKGIVCAARAGNYMISALVKFKDHCEMIPRGNLNEI